MNFLEWLGIKKVMEDTDPKNVIKFPEPKAVPKIPAVSPPKPKEHYRVGFDDQGMTTLTLIADYGNSMTLSMNQEACEQLIRMLRSTYQQEQEEENG